MNDIVKVSSIHIPAPDSRHRSAPEMQGSVRTWSIPLADDGTFSLTRQTTETVTAWDSSASPEPVEYDSKLLDVIATGKVIRSFQMFQGKQMREVQISFSATHKTRSIDGDGGEEKSVLIPLTFETSLITLPSLPFSLHESPRSERNPVRHLLIMEVP